MSKRSSSPAIRHADFVQTSGVIRNAIILGLSVAVVARYFSPHPISSLFAWVMGTSITAFFLMGADKSRARRGDLRIPEMYLFFLALLGGSPGVLLGMSLFRHKTRKGLFLMIIAVTVAVQILIFVRFQSLLGE